jgi:hypothetical protein
MTFSIRAIWLCRLCRLGLAVALWGAGAGLVQGCGKGLFDRASVLADSAVGQGGGEGGDVDGGILPSPDDAPGPTDNGPRLPPPDGDKPPDEVTQVFDANGGQVTLGAATLTIGPGSFRDSTPVQIVMRRFESIPHAGAYGPVFQISVPAPHLFRQLARLTLQVPDLGPLQSFLPSVALGTLDPSHALVDQQWIPTYDTALSSDQKTVSGSLTDFENQTVVQFAVVIGCGAGAMSCPPGLACNSSACQQCPTLSNCP